MTPIEIRFWHIYFGKKHVCRQRCGPQNPVFQIEILRKLIIRNASQSDVCLKLLCFFVVFSISIGNLFTHPTVQSHLCFLFEIFQLILWHRIGLAGGASTLRGMWIWTWQRFNIRLDLGKAMEACVYTCNISNEYAIYHVLQYVFICRGGHGGMTYMAVWQKSSKYCGHTS